MTDGITEAPQSIGKDPQATHDVFAGGSEMGALMRSIDWASTPLGPIRTWPPILRTMVRFILANRFPLLLWWGPQYVCLYNDAYRPILGRKHPASMGRPVAEVWHEIWHVLKPLIDTPFTGGPSTWIEDFPLEINRHGFLEETHFTVAYSPVPDESASRGIGGVLATVHEITDQVLGERRTELLRELGERSGEAKTATEACIAAAKIFERHPQDIPFAFIYLIDTDRKRAQLACTAGVPLDHPLAPAELDLGAQKADVMRGPLLDLAHESLLVNEPRATADLPSRFKLPPGPWSDPPNTMAAIPIQSNLAGQPAGLMFAGVSARIAFDDRYRTFFELVATQVSIAIANARAYETERRRAEALAELDRAKTAFFTNVSHEFRTPLTLVLGPISDMLADARTGPEERERVRIVQRNAMRLLKLVNALLEFSRIEAGRVKASFKPTDLAAFTADLASSFRSAVEQAGLELVVAAPRLTSPVYVDRDMWETIVLNLLSNAFKHTFDGKIEVRVSASDQNAILEVRDTGGGIPSEELSHVFERFRRVSNARSRTHEGTGIGLALVQELTRIHGGTVSVQSSVGIGTVFTVSLPFGAAHLPPEQVATSTEAASATSGAAAYVEEALRWLPNSGDGQEAPGVDEADGKSGVSIAPESRLSPHVLVADDNSDMRDYISRLLRERGWTVEAVSNGRAALAAVQSQPPDILLTDVMMPELDGFELLSAMRKNPGTRSIPVVLLSARAGEEARVEGMQAGADDYLVKPFSARELMARLETQLRRARVLAEEKRNRDAQDRLLTAVDAERARFRNLFTQAPAAIAVFRGADHVFDIANEQYVGMTGNRDLIGKKVRDAFPELDGQGVFEILDQAYKGDSVFARDHRLVADLDGDGAVEERFYNFNCQPVREADGSVSGVFVHAVDVTELVQSRKSAEQDRAAAMDANRAKSDFLAAMSHELRTPLNAIAGHAQLLEMGIHGPVTEAQRQAIERIQQSEGHLLALVNDVLNFARLEAGRIEYDLREISLSELMARVRPMIDPQRLAKEIELDVPTNDDIKIRVDAEKLLQILLNLLSNAIKFTPRGGRITVDTPVRADGTTPEGVVFLRVADTGIGVPREKQEAIFDPFVQINPRLTGTSEGTGLGLAISRDLARGMGGDLRVRSVLKEGARFTVTLIK